MVLHGFSGQCIVQDVVLYGLSGQCVVQDMVLYGFRVQLTMCSTICDTIPVQWTMCSTRRYNGVHFKNGFSVCSIILGFILVLVQKQFLRSLLKVVRISLKFTRLSFYGHTTTGLYKKRLPKKKVIDSIFN